ncbi:MAG: ABC transporter permease [Trueperaceae bacterium]|nr:ABC transporter permease [Trueperaceae bacterium]
MTVYLIQRVLSAIPVLLGLTILVFSLTHLVPGDPAEMMLGEAAVSLEIVESMREQLGLNRPLHVQYFGYVADLLRGDLGTSFLARRSVAEMIGRVLPSTLVLTFAGLGVAVLLGVGLGVLAAVRHNSWLDNLTMVFALVGVSMPSFWLGLMLIFTFSLQLGWFPATGAGGIERLVLPALTLGFAGSAVIARMVRSSVLEVLNQDYVRTAYAKGLGSAAIIGKHVMKNAMIPVLTVVGLEFGRLLSGTVVIEVVFSRPGIGRLLVDAILKKDFIVVQGVVLLSACFYLAVNLLVDLSYGLADPRIRYT